jgi:hypothetical protein
MYIKMKEEEHAMLKIIKKWTCIAFSSKKQLPWSVWRKLLIPFQKEQKHIIGCQKQIKELSVLMSNYIKLTYKRYNIKKIGIENNYTNLVLMVPVEASPVL